MASKEFSNRLKELRKRAGYTQKEVYEHFNIPQSTFSSWEVGKSEPSGDMLIKLCNFYKCDMMKEFSKINDDIVTNADLEFLKKYHALDNYGKELVNIILTKEHARCCDIIVETKNGTLIPIEVKTHSNYPSIYANKLNAAHGRTDIEVTEDMLENDNDIMNSDDF